MSMLRRTAVGVVVAGALALPMTAPTSAAELPTGAARVVQKIQLQVLTGTNNLLFHVDQIKANAAARAGK